MHQRETAGRRHALFVPDGSPPPGGHPVLVHLHGATAPERTVIDDVARTAAAVAEVVAARRCEPFVIVAPFDSSGWSMWADSHDGSDRVRSDTLRIIDEVAATQPVRREATVVQGFSMGGFGAAALAAAHPDRFAAAVIWDGALHDWDTLRSNRPHIAHGHFGSSAESFAAASPWEPGARGADGVPTIVVSGMLVDWADRYERSVQDRGGRVTRHSPECGHDLSCMLERVGFDVYAEVGGLLAV